MYLVPGVGEYRIGNQPALAEAVVNQLDEAAGRQNGPAIITVAADQPEARRRALVAPIKLQGYVIGSMQFYDGAALIEIIAAQVAQTAENIRLLEETRERGSRERAIRDITNKLRAASNLDTLLATTVRELGQRLDARHTVVEIGID
jgi:GAF domain-containing protein